jgi:hypothetical protein
MNTCRLCLAREDAPGRPLANTTQLSSGGAGGFTPMHLNSRFLFGWASQQGRGASPAIAKTLRNYFSLRCSNFALHFEDVMKFCEFRALLRLANHVQRPMQSLRVE